MKNVAEIHSITINPNRWLSALISLIIIVSFLVGCSSTEESNVDGGGLASVTWVLKEASDVQGNILVPRDQVNFVLIFRDDEIYEHLIFCQPRAGFFQYDSSLLLIADAQVTEVADCPVGPIQDGQLSTFLINFFVERELVVDITSTELLLRGIDNDFLRYEACMIDCVTQF